MTEHTLTTQEVKNGYIQRGGKPEHFDEWLQQVKAEAVADFTHTYLDPRHAKLALAYIEESGAQGLV